MTRLSKALSTVLVLSSVAFAGHVSDHLVGVQRSTLHLSLPPRVQQVRGNGICISQGCSVVATAYHIQLLAGTAKLGLAGGHTAKVLSAVSDNDPNKTDIPLAGQSRILSYNIASDVAFLYAKKPLRHKSAVPYSYRYYVGQKVEVAGYNNNKFESRQARIIGSNVLLVMGQAKLEENLFLDISLNAGESGSAVLDQQGNLLGMVILVVPPRFGSKDLAMTVALPVRTIAKALVALDPVLGPAIFKDIPESSSLAESPRSGQQWSVLDEEADSSENTLPVIPELSPVRRDLPNPTAQLQAKAEAASKSMINFIAKQCLVQGTRKPICHELSMVDGQQTFREMKKNGKLGEPMSSFPILNRSVWTQTDWAETLGDIADNSWVFQGVVEDHYLFSFRSSAEDERCHYEEYPQGIPLFSGLHPEWKGSVACMEQILTDKDFNVLSVFSEMIPPDSCLVESLQTAIYYDWGKLEDMQLPVLLPVTEIIAAKVKQQKHLLYATASWTDYKKFRAEHKVKW